MRKMWNLARRKAKLTQGVGEDVSDKRVDVTREAQGDADARSFKVSRKLIDTEPDGCTLTCALSSEQIS